MTNLDAFFDTVDLSNNKFFNNLLASKIKEENILKRFISGFSSIAVISMLTLVNICPTTKAVSLFNEETDGNLSDNGLNPTVLGNLSLGTNSLKAQFNSGEINPSPDYFTLTIPEELVLTEIVLKSWKAEPNFEDIAFFAVQEGTVFDYVFPNDLENSAEGLLGWSHLRSTQVGDAKKILQEMSIANLSPDISGLRAVYQEEASNNPYSPAEIARLPEDVTEEDLINNLTNLADTWVAGATGFSVPLKSGDYSFWLRQGSELNVTVELDFKTARTSVPEPFSIFSIFTTLGLGIILTKKR